MLAFVKSLLRIVGYCLAFIVPVIAAAAYGYVSTMSLTLPLPTPLAASARDTPLKSYDPAKPTVAIVLGRRGTESTDFLIPYELFSRADAYNVYAVAPERTMTSLSGGLEVVPDYTYAELAALLGHAPEVVVIPAIPNPTSAENAPVLTWIKQQAAGGAYIFSICVGAETFAATGLLDGRTATTHWGDDINRIEQAYPSVTWVRGVRYVDGGDYMTSAGITSGMDAVLHYLAEHNGVNAARTIAEAIHYPSYVFVDHPQVEQESADLSLNAVGLINILFHWEHPVAGVLLYDGIGELDLTAAYDTYGASYTTKLISVATTRRLITTQHGLQLAPRWGYADLPAVERLMVPGAQARTTAAADLSAWVATGNAAPVFYLHADAPNAFAFDAPLRDLAQQENIPTAVLDAKRLEYRPGTVQTDGADWPVWLAVWPLLLGLAGLTLALGLGRLRQSSARPQANTPALNQLSSTAER